MADGNTATTNRNQHNHEELEALLEIVPESTVGNLKKLYEELTGEITRSNNKPSLIKRVTAQINHLLENDENANAISAEAEASPESGETEISVADDIENSEMDGFRFEKSDDLQDVANDSEGGGQIADETTKTERATKPKKQRERDPRLPPAGTVLSREYKGERHEVTVLEEGFTYNSEHFRSLSKIAKHIARGTSWNGYLFFKNSLLQAQTEE